MPEENDLIAIAERFNRAWNESDADAVVAFFSDDAIVRIVPPPPPPAPEIYSGRSAIREWVNRTLALPFQVEARNYRASGAVVTWDARFPLEGEEGADDVSEAIFEGEKIREFVP